MLDFVRWAVQGRVLLIQFSGVVTLEDIQQVNQQGLILLEDAVPPHVDLIADTTNVTQFDRDLMNMRQLKTTLITHSLINWHISVTPKPNPAVRFVMGVIFNLMGARYRVMSTVPDALAFLQASSEQPLTRTDLTE